MLSIRCLIFTALLATALASRIFRPKCKPCPLAYRCSPYYSEDLVWAFVDGMCKVFANSCISDSYNCGRMNECKSEIVLSNQEECQKCCASGCENLKEEPHYAYVFPFSSNGTIVQEYCLHFRSECDAMSWSCQMATPITSLIPGVCP